jgi:hypothetical protein
MALERTAPDSLQHRVDQIRATGNDDLWHALSVVIWITGRDTQHVTVPGLRLFLAYRASSV